MAEKTNTAENTAKLSYAQRKAQRASTAQNSMNKVFDEYGENATDEQLAAAAGDNLFAYQTNNGLGWAAAGTALGSDMFGKFDRNTRQMAYDRWKANKDAQAKAEAPHRTIRNQMYDWSNKYGKGFGASGDGTSITAIPTIDERKDIGPISGTQKNTVNDAIADIQTILGENIPLSDDTKAALMKADSPETFLAILSADDAAGEQLEKAGVVFNDDNTITLPHRKTYEEMMAERERNRAEIERQTQERNLQRQQARLGLADLAAGIGDIIKASGGATVTPRNYQQMYDNLTEQQQKNYNMYVARMEALKQKEEARAKELRDRDYAAQRLADQQAYEQQLYERKRADELGDKKTQMDFAARENEKNRQSNERIQKAHDTTKLEKADRDNATRLALKQVSEENKIRANYMNRDGKYAIGYKTHIYTFPNEGTAKTAIDLFHNIIVDELNTNDKFKDNPEYKKNINALLATIGADSDDPYNIKMSRMNTLMGIMEDDLSEDANEKIMALVGQYSNNQGAGGSTGDTGGTVAASSTSTSGASAETYPTTVQTYLNAWYGNKGAQGTQGQHEGDDDVLDLSGLHG